MIGSVLAFPIVRLVILKRKEKVAQEHRVHVV